MDVEVHRTSGQGPGPSGLHCFRRHRRPTAQAARALAAGPSNSKDLTSHPDRNAQFEYLNDTAEAYVAEGQPVISVDTKRKLRHEVARSERTRRSEVRPMPAV
ncbi:MAG: ISAzo13-like element transposase-related protein [Acidimicrobiales bacterium]